MSPSTKPATKRPSPQAGSKRQREVAMKKVVGIAVGQEPVVHCRNIRQAARIVQLFEGANNNGAANSNNHNFPVVNVVCQFLYFPEVLSVGSVVLLRCGQVINAVGTVTLIHPTSQGTIAPRSPVLPPASRPSMPLPSRLSGIDPTGTSLPPPPFGLLAPPLPFQLPAALLQQQAPSSSLLKGEVDCTRGDEDSDEDGAAMLLFGDDEEDKMGKRKPQRGGDVYPINVGDDGTLLGSEMDCLTSNSNSTIDPETRRLEHECKRLSRAERRTRHYAVLLSHKTRREAATTTSTKKQQQRRLEEEDGEEASVTMMGHPAGSYYSSTATATPPLTPDTGGAGGDASRGGVGTWGGYSSSSLSHKIPGNRGEMTSTQRHRHHQDPNTIKTTTTTTSSSGTWGGGGGWLGVRARLRHHHHHPAGAVEVLEGV